MLQYLSVVQVLGLILPALLLAWALGVWLPGQAYGPGSKLLLVALFSFVASTFLAVIVLTYWTDIKENWGAIPLLAIPLIPFMAGVNALLYFGGREVRLRRSRADAILGCLGVVVGILVWIVIALASSYFAMIFFSM